MSRRRRRFGGGGLGGSPPYVFTNAEAAAIVAAMTAPPNNARKLSIDTLVGALKAGGVWAEYDTLHVFAAHDAQAALLNWKNPGVTFTAMVTNAPTFTADRGYTGNGTTSFVSTTFVPATHGVNYILNDASAGLWCRTDGAANGPNVLGARLASANDALLLNPRNASNLAVYTLNADASGATAACTDARGLFGIRRTASNAIAVFRNGASIGTATTVSTTLPPVAVYACGMNTNGTFENGSTKEIAMIWLGGALDDAKMLAAYNAFNTYMVSVGAA